MHTYSSSEIMRMIDKRKPCNYRKCLPIGISSVKNFLFDNNQNDINLIILTYDLIRAKKFSFLSFKMIWYFWDVDWFDNIC